MTDSGDNSGYEPPLPPMSAVNLLGVTALINAGIKLFVMGGVGFIFILGVIFDPDLHSSNLPARERKFSCIGLCLLLVGFCYLWIAIRALKGKVPFSLKARIAICVVTGIDAAIMFIPTLVMGYMATLPQPESQNSLMGCLYCFGCGLLVVPWLLILQLVAVSRVARAYEREEAEAKAVAQKWMKDKEQGG